MKKPVAASILQWFIGGLANPFRLDLRSLALYRVAIGFVLLVDLLMRWVNVTAHYTNAGILSQTLASTSYESFSYGIHGLYDSWWWINGLFLAQVIFATMLIIGYRTRLATLMSFLLLVSLQHRNDLILNSGDVLLRVQLFWSILLPMNKYFSVDLARGRVASALKKTAFSPATIAIVVQTVLLFWQTSTFKTGAAWRETYDALYIALNAEAFAAPWGTWLSQFRSPMRVLTWLAILVEDYAAWLLIVPVFNTLTRSIGLIGLIGLYGGIITTMTIGVFPFIGIATVLVVIPGSAWDALSKFLDARLPKQNLIVYYDQSCGICVSFIHLLSAFGLTRNVTIKHVYAFKKTTELSNKHNSWVGKQGNRYMFKADVFIEIMRRSYLWWLIVPILKLTPVHALATRIYNFVASRRKSVCKPPKPQTWWRKFIAVLDRGLVFVGQGAVLVLIAAVIVWVRSDLPSANDLRVSGYYRQTLRALRLDQYWNMFSPNPIGYNSWVVVEGETSEGLVDAWRPYWDDSDELSFEKITHSYEKHVSPRWRRHLTRMGEAGFDAHRVEFLQYMCRDWNHNNPDRPLLSAKFVELREVTDINGGVEPITTSVLSQTNCR